MVRNEMQVISYHEYGVQAATACEQSAIDELFSLPLPDAIGAALNNYVLMEAVIAWNGFDENLDQATQIIRSAAYMQAHRHLEDLQVIEREEIERIRGLDVDEFPIYPCTIKDLQPAPIITMVEVLNESSMPSHAPTAAATSRLQALTI
jgi:hypothetical protein